MLKELPRKLVRLLQVESEEEVEEPKFQRYRLKKSSKEGSLAEMKPSMKGLVEDFRDRSGRDCCGEGKIYRDLILYRELNLPLYEKVPSLSIHPSSKDRRMPLYVSWLTEMPRRRCECN